LIKERNNVLDRKVFRQNIKIESQKQFGHPLKLEVPLHGERLHLSHFAGKKEKKNIPKHDTQNPNVV
jgi:hypothetical protein